MKEKRSSTVICSLVMVTRIECSCAREGSDGVKKNTFSPRVVCGTGSIFLQLLMPSLPWQSAAPSGHISLSSAIGHDQGVRDCCWMWAGSSVRALGRVGGVTGVPVETNVPKPERHFTDFAIFIVVILYCPSKVVYCPIIQESSEGVTGMSLHADCQVFFPCKPWSSDSPKEQLHLELL